MKSFRVGHVQKELSMHEKKLTQKMMERVGDEPGR